MPHTTNQHVLSQWILRLFRSDCSANKEKAKQRTWCHTVYWDNQDLTDVKEIPLKISSVGMRKDCFTLINAETNEKFDIEQELRIYENKTSHLFNDLISNNNFNILLNYEPNSALDTLLNFMVIQWILNLDNPQNKYDNKEEIYNNLIKHFYNNFEDLKYSINNPPSEFIYLFESPIYKKIKLAVNSKSPKDQVCKTLFVLFLIATSEGLPTLSDALSELKNILFKGINIEAIYHTGYNLDSTEPRPVFTIGPNIMSFDNCMNIYLPLSHNFAIKFSTNNAFTHDKIRIYTTNPYNLKCKTNSAMEIYKVSHDYIDCITGHMNGINNSFSKTIYSSHNIDHINEYMDLQNNNEEFFYIPENPELIS